jgi:hypothetical protein
MPKFLLALSLSLVALLAPAAAKPAPRVVADMPMLSRGASPAVNVFVNGKGPYLFLIDTGGQGDARADTSLVGELGLAAVGQNLSGDGSGRNTRTLDLVILDRLDVGGLRFRNVAALSRDYNRSPSLPRISGILGYNLFKDHLLTLDFRARRVRIEQGALPPADGKTILDYEAPYDTPIVEMSMSGLRLLADIDSGDIGGITFPQALAQMLPRSSEPRIVGTGRSISNEFQVSEVKLRGNLRIGEHELADPVIRFNDVHDNINLGAAFLAGYVVTFDQKNRRVRIVAPE